MSTMPATHGHSEACCNVPPVVSTGYSPKGSYDEIHGYKTCKDSPKRTLLGLLANQSTPP